MLKLTNLYVILSVFCVVAIAAPYQELPPKPGHIPVYIREGNTPLSQVNPKLAEAFHENEKTETPKDADVSENDKTDEVLEVNIKEDEEEKSEQSKQISKDQDKSYDKEEKQEPEPLVSDIAEFTSDDIKILADDKTDN